MRSRSMRKGRLGPLLFISLVAASILAVGIGGLGGSGLAADPRPVAARSSAVLQKATAGDLSDALWAPAAIFNDGVDATTFTVTITGGDFDSVWLETSRVLDGDLDLPEVATTFGFDSLVQLFDNGTQGDAVAGDGVFSRSGITGSGELSHDGGSHERIDTLLVFLSEDEISFFSDEAFLEGHLGVVNADLRDTTAVTEIGPGLTATSHALFVVDDGTIYPNYPNVDASGAVDLCLACQVLIEEFGDVFDFIVLQNLELLQDAGGCDCQAFFSPVQNDVLGIGSEPFELFGPFTFEDGTEINSFSQERLRGTIWNNRIDGSPLSHEVMHNWSFFAAPDFGWLDEDQAHPSALTTINGIMDGEIFDEFGLVTRPEEPEANTDLVANGDGTFRLVSRVGEYNATFAPFSLYVAGFIPVSEVPAADVLFEPVDFSDPDRVTAAAVEEFTVQDLIAVEGERAPSSATAPTDFTVGVLVISDDAYSEAEYAFTTLMLRYWESDKEYDGAGSPPWKAATLGLSALTVELPVELPDPVDEGEPEATRTQTLQPEWNLVGWTGSESPIATVLSGIASSLASFSIWNANALAFLSFNPALPVSLNSLQLVPQGAGIWTFVNGSAPLAWEQPAFDEARSVTLASGFNLVMWTGPDGTPITEALANLSSFQGLWLWDALGQGFLSFNPLLPPQLNGARVLNHGDGIWLLMSGAGTWQQPAS